MNGRALLILAFLLSACTKQQQSFIPVQGLGGSAVDSKVQQDLFLKTAANPKQLMISTWDDDGGEGRAELNGVVFADIFEEKAKRILDADYDHLKALGYKIFLTNLHFDNKLRSQWDVAVVKGYSDLDLLRKFGVSGPNYDITNAQVVAQAREWQKRMKLEFVAFENDRFEAKIVSSNYDVNRLADENYKLCPDVIEQGYGTREELLKGLREEKYLWCWWD